VNTVPVRAPTPAHTLCDDMNQLAFDTIASLNAHVPTAPTSALRPLKYTTHLVIDCHALRAVLEQFAELEQENRELEMNKRLRPLPCTRLIFTDCTANNNEVTAPGSSASTNPNTTTAFTFALQNVTSPIELERKDVNSPTVPVSAPTPPAHTLREREMNQLPLPLPCTRLIFTDCTANNNEVTASGSSVPTNPNITTAFTFAPQNVTLPIEVERKDVNTVPVSAPTPPAHTLSER